MWCVVDITVSMCHHREKKCFFPGKEGQISREILAAKQPERRNSGAGGCLRGDVPPSEAEEILKIKQHLVHVFNTF